MAYKSKLPLNEALKLKNTTQIKEYSFADTDLGYYCFERNLFVDCDFKNATFTANKFIMCTFINCSFVGADFNQSNFKNCDFIRCNCYYAVVDDSIFDNCKFENCDFTCATIANAKFTNITFRIKTSFHRAVIDNTDFTNSKLSVCDFSRAHLNNVNFTDAIVPVTNMAYGKYTLCYVANNIQIRFICGCRHFTINEARKHWLSNQYPDPVRGKRMYSFCKMLHDQWKENILFGIDRNCDK